MKEISYTSASVEIPAKLLHNKILDKKGRIIPKHVCLLPTNKCNGTCRICFCKNRNINLELKFNKAIKIIDTLKKLGTQAISISGGGDPLMYPQINELIQYIKRKGIDVGLTTNGIALEILSNKTLNCLTWCRISTVSERNYDFNKLEEVIERGKNVDWNFSYVVSNEINFNNLIKLIEFANKNNFTHIRIVGEMMDEKNQQYIEYLKNHLAEKNVDTSLIIWQKRQFYVQGQKECWLSLLRPIVGPDENVYPCCGIHYATNPPELDFNEKNKLCNIKEYPNFINKQKCFDGSKCIRCDYGSYNKVLELLKKKPEHIRFL